MSGWGRPLNPAGSEPVCEPWGAPSRGEACGPVLPQHSSPAKGPAHFLIRLYSAFLGWWWMRYWSVITTDIIHVPGMCSRGELQQKTMWSLTSSLFTFRILVWIYSCSVTIAEQVSREDTKTGCKFHPHVAGASLSPLKTGRACLSEWPEMGPSRAASASAPRGLLA